MNKVRLTRVSRYFDDIPGKKYIVYFEKNNLIFHPKNRKSTCAGLGETKPEAMKNAINNLRGASNEERRD